MEEIALLMVVIIATVLAAGLTVIVAVNIMMDTQQAEAKDALPPTLHVVETSHSRQVEAVAPNHN